MTATQEFTDIFRTEHRAVRDLLFALIEAFQSGELPQARSLLVDIAAATGPHFRYEEEAMYPRLVDIFGDDYVDKLLDDHDIAITNARALVDLAAESSLSDDDTQRAVTLVRQTLPHVSDCDGLSIMVETFPEDDVRDILTTRDAARERGLNLLDWASGVRPRQA